MSGCEESFSTKLAMEIFSNLLAHTANCLQTVPDQSALIVESLAYVAGIYKIIQIYQEFEIWDAHQTTWADAQNDLSLHCQRLISLIAVQINKMVNGN